MLRTAGRCTIFVCYIPGRALLEGSGSFVPAIETQHTSHKTFRGCASPFLQTIEEMAVLLDKGFAGQQWPSRPVGFYRTSPDRFSLS